MVKCDVTVTIIQLCNTEENIQDSRMNDIIIT